MSESYKILTRNFLNYRGNETMNDKMRLILLITLLAVLVIVSFWAFLDMKAHPFAAAGGAAIVLISYNAKWIWNAMKAIRDRI